MISPMTEPSQPGAPIEVQSAGQPAGPAETRPEVSPVPPGPGAQAPFPAPPAEGGGARLGWGLSIAGLVLALCCGGGLAAGVGLIVTTVAAVNEQARAVVGDYLDALRDGNYPRAYELLCDDEQAHLTQDRFASREETRPRLRSYEVGDVDVNRMTLPVTEEYADGDSRQITYLLRQDGKTGRFEVCGRE